MNKMILQLLSNLKCSRERRMHRFKMLKQENKRKFREGSKKYQGQFHKEVEHNNLNLNKADLIQTTKNQVLDSITL